MFWRPLTRESRISHLEIKFSKRQVKNISFKQKMILRDSEFKMEYFHCVMHWLNKRSFSILWTDTGWGPSANHWCAPKPAREPEAQPANPAMVGCRRGLQCRSPAMGGSGLTWVWQWKLQSDLAVWWEPASGQVEREQDSGQQVALIVDTWPDVLSLLVVSLDKDLFWKQELNILPPLDETIIAHY